MAKRRRGSRRGEARAAAELAAFERLVDRALASACLLNDAGDFYFRLIGHRLDGEAGIALPARSQPFEQQLQRVWDRSRVCSELRALGI